MKSLAQIKAEMMKNNPFSSEAAPFQLQAIGVNEAPDMNPKAYVSPDDSMRQYNPPGGVATPNGLPIGGIDTNPQQPGQQFMPQNGMMPQSSPNTQGKLPQQGQPQGQQGMPQGGPMMPPQPPSPMGNMLQMTPQGRAMSAMQPPMPQGGPQGAPQGLKKGGQPSKEDNPLVVIHNISSEKLGKADQLGGFAVPSLAIVNPSHGFHSFGDISLVGHPGMAKPSKGNPVFASDVYSPRFPPLNDDETKIFKGYTNLGNRRYAPLTLENAVKEMKGNLRGGEGWITGAGNARAGVTPKFKNFDQVKNSSTKIIPEQDFEPLKDESNNKVLELAEKFHPFSLYSGNQFQHANDFVDMLREAGTKGIGSLKQYHNDNLPPELLSEAQDFLHYLKNMPTQYFEAKPQRGVGIHEFVGAIVPHHKIDEVKPILDKHGISRIETYGGDTHEENMKSKQDALSKFSDQFFSYGGSVKKQKKHPVSISHDSDVMNLELTMKKKGK